MKKGLFAILILFVGCVSLLAGCVNPYKNMVLSLSETQVEIELKNNTEDVTPVVVTASVSGVGSKVSKNVIATTQSNCISLSTTVNEDGNTEISILPVSTATEKTAIVTVATEEGGKSAEINVRLFKKPTEMFTNENYKPAVSVNGVLQLNGALAVNYGTNSDDVTEKDVSFSLVGTYSGVTLSETGLLRVGNVKPPVGENGYSEIKVNVKNISTNLTSQLSVRVIKAITSQEQISMTLDGKPTEDLIIRLNENAKPILAFNTTEGEENYEFSVTPENASVVGVLKLNDVAFELSALSALSTNLQVSCFVKGYEQYSPFVFTVPIRNVFVPTGVLINNSRQQNQELSLFTSYINGTFGTAIKVDIEPNGVEEHNSYIKIYSDNPLFNNIKWMFSDQTEITNLNSIPSGITIYASIKENFENINQLNNLEIVFESVTFPDIKNSVKVKTYQSINSATVQNLTEISTNTELKEQVLMIENQKSIVLDLELKDALNASINLENTDLAAIIMDGKQDYVSVNKEIVENKQVFVFTAKKVGEVNVALNSLSGFYYLLKVKIVNAVNEADVSLSLPTVSDSSSVAYLNLNSETKTATYKIFQNKTVDIKFNKNSQATTIEKFKSNYQTCCAISDNGKISTYNFNANSNTAVLTATLIGWKFEESVCTEIEITYTINLIVVEGISNVNIEVDEPYSDIVYMADSVGALYPNLSKTSLSVSLSNSIMAGLSDTDEDKVLVSWFINDSEIEWQTDSELGLEGVQNIQAQKLENVLNLKFASLDEYNETNNFHGVDSLTLLVKLKFTQYERTIEFFKEIKVIRAETVSDIVINNLKHFESSAPMLKYQAYFDARNGLNKEETEFKDAVNALTINATAVNDKALNKKLRFYSSNSAIVKVDEFSGKVMPVGAGQCYVYVISEDSVTSVKQTENESVVDVENVGSYKNRPKANRIIAIQIFVADGTKTNPFAISTAKELQDINASAENLTYHYVLDSFIDLSGINFTPIGSLIDSSNGKAYGFSGGIKGGREVEIEDEMETYQFSISNLTINSEHENVGLISTLNSGAELARITLINFNISSNYENARVGALAGVNNGTITGTYVHWTQYQQGTAGVEFVTSFNNENYDLIGTISANNSANVGGVVGTNAGTIENVSVHCETTGITGGVVGGIAGENQSEIINCLVNATLSGVTAGGIAGKNTANSTISKGFVEIYNKNETISGTSVAGGIVGENAGEIKLSYIRSFVNDSTFEEISCTKMGAFAGTNGGAISETYAMLNMAINAAAENTGSLTDYFVNETKSVNNSDNWNEQQTELKNNPVEPIPESISVSFKELGNFNNYENANTTLIAYLKSKNSVANAEDNCYVLKDLVEVTPDPVVSHLQLVAESSNLSVASIILNEGEAKLKLNGTGETTITITALKNKGATCSFKLYVVKGVSEINYESSGFNTDKNVLTIEKYQTVKINAIASFGNFDANQNIQYEPSLSESELESYGLIFNATNLTFKATKKCDAVQFELKPYLQIAENIKIYLSNTITFTIKCTERANLISVNKTGDSIYPIDETEIIVTMLTTKNIDENEDEILDENSENIISSVTGETGILNISAPVVGKVLKVNDNKYWQVTFTYTVKVADNKKATISAENKFTIEFTSSLWTESNPTVYAEYKLTIIPQKLINISAQHFPKGVGPYKQKDKDDKIKEPEAPTDIIIPGETGILQLDLYPTYAKMKNIYISSSSAGGDTLTFEQVKYVVDENNDGFYKIDKVYPSAIYLPDGSLSLTVSETESIYYLKTYISTNTTENSVFTITVRGVGVANGEEEIVRTFNFTVRNRADASIDISRNKAFVSVAGTQYLLVAGLEAEVNVNQERFNNENIDIKVVEGSSTTAVAGITLERKLDATSVNGNVTTYKYALKFNDDFDYTDAYSKTYKIKFTAIANTNGLSETIERSIEFKLVKEKIENFQFVAVDSDFDFNVVPYNGFKTYYLTAIKFDKDNPYGTEIKSTDSSSEIYGLVTADYVNRINEDVSIICNNGVIKVSGMKISTDTGLKLKDNIKYGYSDGEWTFDSSVIDNNEIGTINCSCNLIVREVTSSDNPYPITTAEEFKAKLAEILDEPLDYILMNDITLDKYTPINFNAKSFDGNGKIITINQFDASSFYADGFAKESIALGLFNEISENSIVKNVVLNISNATIVNNNEDISENQVVENSTNLSMFKNVDVAFFAVTNNGIINNCSVGNYERTTIEQNGEKVSYISENTTGKTYEFTTSNSHVETANFSLFVGTNNGYISNSRVNGINNENNTNWASNKNENHWDERLHLKANGNLAGFAWENSGAISSSYAKAIKLENTSIYVSKTKTSGFVIDNIVRARIMYSYSMGFGTYSETSNLRTTLEGNALITKGTGAGFIYSNNGSILDCYSNISLCGIKSQSGGFVYENEINGSIENCVAVSKIIENSTLTSLFCANNTLNQSNNSGKLINCYAYNQANNLNSITDTEIGVALLSLNEFFNPESYSFKCDNRYTAGENGMVEDGGLSGANWQMQQYTPTPATIINYGPCLAVANQKIERIRTVKDGTEASAPVVAEEGSEGNEDAEGSNNTSEYKYEYNELNGKAGSRASNPYLIYSAESYKDFLEDITDTNNEQDFKNGYHALFVCDVSFKANKIPSQKLKFKGTFNGGGFDISDISMVIENSEVSSDSSTESFGFFESTEEYEINNAQNLTIIKNANLNIVEVTATKYKYVGAVAGSMNKTNLFDIKVVSEEGATVTGKNIVGGITGYAQNVKAFNCTNDGVSISAEYAHGSIIQIWDPEYEKMFSVSSATSDFSTYAYAGGLFGMVSSSSNLGKATVKNNVVIKGENAGGVVGYLGAGTEISDTKFVALWNQPQGDFKQTIQGVRNAGAIAAHSAGEIEFATLDCENELFKVADESTINTASRNNHISNLFSKTNYRSGPIIGYMVGGTLENSYSRVDLRNQNAHIAGGLVGEMTAGTISNCYTTSSVYAYKVLGDDKAQFYPQIGGLVGLINLPLNEGEYDTSLVKIENCVALNRWKTDTMHKDGSFHVTHNVTKTKVGNLYVNNYEINPINTYAVARKDNEINIDSHLFTIENYMNNFYSYKDDSEKEHTLKVAQSAFSKTAFNRNVWDIIDLENSKFDNGTVEKLPRFILYKHKVDNR